MCTYIDSHFRAHITITIRGKVKYGILLIKNNSEAQEHYKTPLLLDLVTCSLY